jgi:hypothetical protein
MSVRFLEGTVAKLKREIVLTRRVSLRTDGKGVLLDWREGRPTGVTGWASYWIDGKGVLLDWREGRFPGVREERPAGWWEELPARVAGRASCSNDWKSVPLEWREERPARVTGRASCSFTVGQPALLVLLVLLISVCPLSFVISVKQSKSTKSAVVVSDGASSCSSASLWCGHVCPPARPTSGRDVTMVSSWTVSL